MAEDTATVEETSEAKDTSVTESEDTSNDEVLAKLGELNAGTDSPPQEPISKTEVVEEKESGDPESSTETAPKLTRRQMAGAKALGITPEEAVDYNPAVLEQAGKMRSELTRQNQDLSQRYSYNRDNEPGTESQPEELEEFNSDKVLKIIDGDDGEAGVATKMNELQDQVRDGRRTNAELQIQIQGIEDNRIETTADTFFDGLNKEDYKILGTGPSSELDKNSPELQLRKEIVWSAMDFRKSHFDREGTELSYEQAYNKGVLDVIPDTVKTSKERKAKRVAREANKGSIPPPTSQSKTVKKGVDQPALDKLTELGFVDS